MNKLSDEQIDLKEWEKEDNEVSEISQSTFNKDNQLRVIRTNQDYNLDYLNQSIGKTIILGPHYQRRSRWSRNQKSLLIESFLLNIPVPPIFLFEKEGYHEYEVVDGRQRLEAISDFFENRFKLRNLEHFAYLNGKRYNDLEQQEQRLLMRRTISATVLLAESKGFDKLDIRMLLFDRLNTGGVKLNAQELRNAIFSGSFNNFIETLSNNSIYRKVWGIPNPNEISDDKEKEKLKRRLKNNPLYKSMMDCELVLRIFGLREAYFDAVDGSMKQILNFTMKKYQNISVEKKLEFTDLFEGSITGIYDILGEDFIKNPILTPPKKARNIYDSLMVAYGLIDKNKLKTPAIIKNNLLKVLQDGENYEKIITKGNSVDNIKFRIDKAIEIFTQDI